MLLALLLQDDPLLAEAVQGYKNPWADFREGARVTYRETVRRPGIDAGGNLVYTPLTSDTTWTVATVEATKIHLKIEGGGQESVIPIALAPPNWARGKPEKKGEEELEVSGRKVSGRVYELGLDLDKDAGQLTTIVRSDAIPYWALRRKVETRVRGKANTSEEERVVGVEEKLRAAAQDFVCTIVEVTTEAAGAGKTVKKEWRTDAVPGRVLRREVRQFLNGKELPSGASEMEVVSFDLKR